MNSQYREAYVFSNAPIGTNYHSVTGQLMNEPRYLSKPSRQTRCNPHLSALHNFFIERLKIANDFIVSLQFNKLDLIIVECSFLHWIASKHLNLLEFLPW